MKKNEELLQKLRDFRMEQMIKLKNENPDVEVDIEDVIYCGQIELEVNGENQKKDVFLAVKNINGNIKMMYYIDGEEIAIQEDVHKMFDKDGIIPTEKYVDKNKEFEQISQNEKISLNELESERLNDISKTMGIDEKDILASAEIDAKKLNEEELLRKNVNIKSEFRATQKITSTENFENIVPGANKFNKIAVVYSDKTSDKFMLVGITNDGKVEKLEGLERTEGVSPTENIVTSNRYGENVQKKTASAMFKVKGRPNEGFSMNIGNSGGVEVNYVRRSTDDDYLSIPVEATHTRYVKSEIKRDMDKTKNTRVEEEVNRAEGEFKEHNGKADFRNIDDNPNNDVNHENIIKTKDGEEKTYEEVIEQIEKEQKISKREAERLFEKNYDEGETVEKVLDDVEEEIEDQMRIPRR